ncbi:MAG: hypothetical protein AAB281_03105, partial [Actinomycetota bacterium]
MPVTEDHSHGEAGQILLIALIISAFAVTVVLALLPLVSSGLRATAAATDSTRAYYTAAAGVEAVLADLVVGRDILAPGYAAPAVALNDLTASITVRTPELNARP